MLIGLAVRSERLTDTTALNSVISLELRVAGLPHFGKGNP